MEARRPEAPANAARALRVVKKLEFVQAVEEALGRVLARRPERFEAALVKELRHELRAEVLGALRKSGRRVRGMTKSAFLAELERSRDRILSERARATKELLELKERVAELERGGATHSEIEGHVRDLLVSSGLDQALPEDLRMRLLAFATQAAETELQRAGHQPRDPEEVARLERRIAKLVGETARMEEALAKLAKMKDVDAGEASIYRTVQGLAQIDEMFERKQELLRDIFESNVALLDEIEGPPVAQ